MKNSKNIRNPGGWIATETMTAPTETVTQGEGSSQLGTPRKATTKTLQVETLIAVQWTLERLTASPVDSGETCQEIGKDLHEKAECVM